MITISLLMLLTTKTALAGAPTAPARAGCIVSVQHSDRKAGCTHDSRPIDAINSAITVAISFGMYDPYVPPHSSTSCTPSETLLLTLRNLVGEGALTQPIKAESSYETANAFDRGPEHRALRRLDTAADSYVAELLKTTPYCDGKAHPAASQAAPESVSVANPLPAADEADGSARKLAAEAAKPAAPILPDGGQTNLR